MRTLRILAVTGVSALAPLALVACGSSKSASSSATTASAATAAAAPTSAAAATTAAASGSGGSASASGATLGLATLDGKQVLVDGKGMAVYLFTKDTGNTSVCTGGCADEWPAVVAGATLTPGTGIDAKDLGTSTRADGTKQVTFDGKPVYTYAKDTAAGQTNGEGVGGVWFLIDSQGNAVKS